VYVLDENGRGVLRALENPKYDWRTIDGVSEETGLPPYKVAQIVQLLPNVNVEVVRSSVPDKHGRPLFTTRNHYSRRRTFVNRLLTALSDRIR
jgi:hypothetical protein